jgi:hypothetical protein
MRRVLTLLALASAFSAPAADARMHDPEKLPVTRVRDLHYGDVLFYLYQGDDLTAATRLLAYEQWERIPHHESEGRLLLGGLYLSLGLHNEAGQIFEKLLGDDVPTGVRNRAWFYLAQVWYERGYLDKAEGALRHVNGRMSPELQARKEHLFANVLIHQDKVDEAVKLLAASRSTDVWGAYARFNLGVALVRKQRLADGESFLTAVGTLESSQPEMLALRDRANLAIGFAYLQAGNPTKARGAFERVRLDGPFSNKALLGTGYADAAAGDFERALTPWTVLRGRNVLDSAVQESYIAVPYAYSKLGANDQSVEYYQDALNSLETESGRIDASVNRIRDGSLLKAVLGAEREDGAHDWYWQLRHVPDAPESRYLYAVLAGYDFQVGLRSYRDMLYMDDTMARWDDSMDAFRSMIDTREKAYQERLPAADSLLGSGTLDSLRQRRQDVRERLQEITQDGNVAALGSPEEQQQWARVLRDEAALDGKPADDDSAQAAAKLRLIKGVLYFRLNESYRARLWQQQRTMKDLDVALREAQSRWIRVERARKNVPMNTGDFARKVTALKERIASVRVRLAAVQEKQKVYLAQLAIDQLGQQKDRLSAYQVQARFALANMYDRAATAASAVAKRPDTDTGTDTGTDADVEPVAAPLPPGAPPPTEPRP